MKKIESFDPRSWSLRLAQVQPSLHFTAENEKEARRWQSTLRRQFVKRLGGFPAAKTPLRPRTLAVEEYSDHMRESVSFQSRDGLRVFGYLLLPKGRPKPLPAIICFPGHGYGVDALVGLDAFGKPRTEEEYQHDFALQCVRHGHATLAVEILGFGRRREGIGAGEFEAGSETSSCGTLAGTALMLGESIAGWRTYDAIRALDYLQTRPEVNSKRIGAMGISGGGLNALFFAAVDERVRATMVSGYLNTFAASVMQINHCIDNYIPGLRQDAEMSDIAGLIAPRALWCESGTRDSIFPLKTFRSALRETQKIYATLGAREKCRGQVFDGEHQFHGTGAWPFLQKYLKE